MDAHSKGVLSLVAGLLLSLVLLSAASPQEYTIGAGDVLAVAVWGQPDLSREYPVDLDGFVPFPLLGRVQGRGLTTKEFAARLTELLEKDYLVNPHVIVTVKEYRSQKVLVLGEASRPGLFYLTGPTTVLEILSSAGGLSRAAGKHVLLVRNHRLSGEGAGGGATILRLNVEKMQAGDASENLPIQAADTILVPKERENSFFMLGQIKKPGAYPFDKETNILEAITMAGGFTDKAAPSRTRVLRPSSTGTQIIQVDMNDIIKQGQRDKAIPLQENDVVVVPESFF